MKKFISLVLVIILSCNFSLTAFGDSYSEDDINKSAFETIEALFEIDENQAVKFDKDFLESAGTTSGDWYVVALKALDIQANYSEYLNAINLYVKEKYETDSQLHAVKATEWHRISLAVMACGGDPTNVSGINLIADGTYARDVYNKQINKQGIMGYFWALISLDSNSFIIPDNLPITREEIIQSIIQSQLDDGGFSLSGTSGDSDVTAIALTALSPYKDDDNIKVSINKGIEFLSQVQLSNGGYQSYGAPNSESSSQVIIALCSLGINPMTDERFIKNGASVLDSLEKYRAENGEYYHMLGDNQKTNRLATQQGLLAMVAMSKYLSGSQGIYSFKPEPIDNNDDNNNDIDNDVKFTDYDRNRVEQLLEDVQASDLNEINRLIQKLEETKSSFNTNTNTNTNTSDNISNHTSTSDYNDLYSKLYNAKEKSEKILIKINNTISDIWELNKVFNLSDKKKISEIKKACEGLSEDDLKLVENYDVLEKLEAEYNSKVRSLVVTIMIIIFVIGAILVLIIRRIKRHRLKNN